MREWECKPKYFYNPKTLKITYLFVSADSVFSKKNKINK